MNAYEQTRNVLFDASIALSNATHNDLTEYDAEECLAKVDAALALPRRNCDVGTPEEQTERFMSYCHSKVCKRRVCHSYGYEKLFYHECFPIWAQMPYESEVK